MVEWANHNGILLAFMAFVFSLIVGAAPKELPASWGFWRLWMFGAVQALGANAGKFSAQSPVIKTLQATELKKDGSGNTVQTDTHITTTPATAGGEVPKL